MLSNEELYKILQQALDISFDDDEEAILRDYVSEEAITALELNLKFFRDIPKSNLVEVFRELLFLIYSNEQYNYYTSQLKGHEEKDQINIKPSKQLEKDIKTIKNFQVMFKRLFNAAPNIEREGDSFPIIISKGGDPFKRELHKLYNGIEKILNDLEKEEFKIVSKRNYYKDKPISKSNIEKLLIDIKTKYNLKGVSLELKQIKDNLPNKI